eukprot:s562_g5.t2
MAMPRQLFGPRGVDRDQHGAEAMLRAARLLARPALGRLHAVQSMQSMLRPRHCITVHFMKQGEDGTTTVSAKSGQTILEVAHEHDIDIEGACGGECACSTCHVLLEQEAYSKLPEPDDDEARGGRFQPWDLGSTKKENRPPKLNASYANAAMAVARPRVAVFNMEIVGTVNPILPVVAELVQRGCEVRYYLSKETYVSDVASAGAEPVRFDDFCGRWEEVMQEALRSGGGEDKEWLQSHGYGPAAFDALPGKDESMMIRMMIYSLPAGCCLGRRLAKSWSQGWCPDVAPWLKELVFMGCSEPLVSRVALATRSPG